jgi:tRNA nucleotidyltransferase (CCA-adding enzyme)
MSQFNLPPGPLIGEILNDLLEMVLDNPSANNRDTLHARATQFLAEKK